VAGTLGHGGCDLNALTKKEERLYKIMERKTKPMGIDNLLVPMIFLYITWECYFRILLKNMLDQLLKLVKIIFYIS